MDVCRLFENLHFSIRPWHLHKGKGLDRTFGKQSGVSIDKMAAQEPPVAKFVISFNKLDSISLGEAQFIGASCLKIICNGGTRSAYPHLEKYLGNREE